VVTFWLISTSDSKIIFLKRENEQKEKQIAKEAIEVVVASI
jgi:hypothetical protein